jgi:hypothetical protein
MIDFSRRQVLATASGIGAATILAGAIGASAKPLNIQQEKFN